MTSYHGCLENGIDSDRGRQKGMKEVHAKFISRPFEFHKILIMFIISEKYVE